MKNMIIRRVRLRQVKKSYFIKIYAIMIMVCLSLCIVACESAINMQKEKDIKGNQVYRELNAKWKNAEILKNKIFSIISILPEKQKEIETEDIGLYDYEKYLHKIWIVNEWEMEDIHVHYSGFSFYITKIDKGRIEGKISTGMYIAEPNYYIDDSEGLNKYPEFSGTILGDNAKCSFKDREGNEGVLEIKLINENNIMATVKYTDINKVLNSEGSYRFRPYNLSDEESWRTVNTALEVTMDSWGTVKIVGGKAKVGRFTYGFSNIVNKNGDIFYDFSAEFHTGAEVTGIYSEDYNNDGLMDVKLIEQFYADDVNDIEWIFLQREDGTFNLKKED